MSNREDLARQKEEILAKLTDIEAEEARLLAASDDVELAEALHDMLCHWNHTDGCGWFYEFKDGEANWDGWAHERYLKKARGVMKELPDMDVSQILRVAKAIH